MGIGDFNVFCFFDVAEDLSGDGGRNFIALCCEGVVSNSNCDSRIFELKSVVGFGGYSSWEVFPEWCHDFFHSGKDERFCLFKVAFIGYGGRDFIEDVVITMGVVDDILFEDD